MPRVNLRIDGMSCEHCVRAVREALAGLPGVRVEEVKVGGARIEIDDLSLIQNIRSVLEEEGYQLTEHSAAA